MGRAKFKNKKETHLPLFNRSHLFKSCNKKGIHSNSKKNYKSFVENELSNKYLFFTPISKEKKNVYIPSTPTKPKIDKELIKDNNYEIKGKNLLLIFETM